MSKRLMGLVALSTICAAALASNSDPSLTFLTSNSKASDVKIVPSQSLPSFVKAIPDIS